jgi:hypothetical protein
MQRLLRSLCRLPSSLPQVDFLRRAEVAEYERERDARLASDVRTRGRL